MNVYEYETAATLPRDLPGKARDHRIATHKARCAWFRDRTAWPLREGPGIQLARIRRDARRTLDNAETVDLFRAAGQSSLRLQSPGLRFLLGFLEVKRPGIEVLRQIEVLSSLERVALRIVSGTWQEPEESADNDSVFAILEVLEEASHVGVLELGLDKLPGRPMAIQTLVGHVRRWFVAARCWRPRS